MSNRITCPITTSDLKDPMTAIRFAVDYMQPEESHYFLKELLAGEDLSSWIEAWEYDQEEARRMTDPNWTPS
ncbi:hypothetical protein [Nitratireductor pacificus]|uniref:Uncharacterized protein n=1 Tax=Nitratireductor pacificus pht-3B TaxID=391937 RepID=K2M7A3_9HYPH|nr:hypothetical protein [Nitratireductor pacificus]EKF16895.1 hypothetical protein NA2_20704 [Nitratireductor pacificus pht-3B]